eukprot:TRINITY_DN4373_c0_g1_i12.p1 TRINITY_DN4373_c0_g1~~TRINITY_DN4373_c0_g1_i12.p1  ORF type:complete len:341 (-),score=132.40 TRINITY_DN4373_c0_g1_i12:100-1122(-)
MRTILSIALLLVAVVYFSNAEYTRPIIGILTLPCTGSFCKKSQYFPASYPKFIEAAGARVVPIFYDMTTTEVKSVLDNVNGVLFTGGDASLTDTSTFFKTVQLIYNTVVDKNSQGVYFPLWGTCLGFEGIIRACSADPDILSSFDAWNYSIPLQPTTNAFDARIFSQQGQQALKLMMNEAMTLHNHEHGVSPTDFAANANLNSTFKVLGINNDRQGVPFVSMIEAINLPIYATQFHPEKNLFEWNTDENILHSSNSMLAMHYLADFFVRESRRNSQSYPTEDDASAAVLYNYSPSYTPDIDFEQCYFFDDAATRARHPALIHHRQPRQPRQPHPQRVRLH